MTDAPKSIEERLAALETKAAHSVPCGRCSSLVDVTVMRENGPKLMERDGVRVVVCNECVPFAKRHEWKLAKIDPVPTEQPKEEEVQK